MTSPYEGHPATNWPSITAELVKAHPLEPDEIVGVVLTAWESIFESRFTSSEFRIGKQIFPKPQIMGFLLHELIPLELHSRFPAKWRGDEASSEKDLVYLPDSHYSIELKTSSNPRHIYGNRSYAQKTTRGKKSKTGYYLAVNFEKVSKEAEEGSLARVLRIRFGWLDSIDWIGQAAQTGQQARLSSEVENGKLLQLYSCS